MFKKPWRVHSDTLTRALAAGPWALRSRVRCVSRRVCTVFLWFNVPCHAPAPGKGVQGTRGVHWAAPRGGVQVGGVQLLLPGFCTPRLPGRSTWRPAEYPDNVSLTGVFRSLTQPRTNKPIPKSPMSRDAQCAARNLDFDVGLCVGQTGLMGVH